MGADGSMGSKISGMSSHGSKDDPSVMVGVVIHNSGDGGPGGASSVSIAGLAVRATAKFKKVRHDSSFSQYEVQRSASSLEKK